MIADCPTQLRPDELSTFGDSDGSTALADEINDSGGQDGILAISPQRVGAGRGGAESDHHLKNQQNGLSVVLGIDGNGGGSGGRPAISPRSPTQQYHHHRRRPLLMLFQSDEARVASQQLARCGVVPSRFMVSPTPNALPAATAATPPHDAPSSPISKALRHPLRVIVACADDDKCRSPASGTDSNDTPSPLSPPSSPEPAGGEMTSQGRLSSAGRPAKSASTAGAVSPASVSSVDSGVVVSCSGAPSPSPLDSRRVLFTIAGEVVPPSSQYNFTEVNSVRSTALSVTADSLAIMTSSDSGGWKFRERSVSECFVEARQITMRRQQCILEEEDEKSDSPTPTEQSYPPLPTSAVHTSATPGSPVVVTSAKGSASLKGILKKSTVYSSQQLSTSKSAPYHFRRAPTYFALCRSVSDLSSTGGAEQRAERPACIPSMELEDGGDLRSHLLRMNHQFNAMILENLCEEKTPDGDGDVAAENMCSSPSLANEMSNNADGSGSIGSLVSADSGDSLMGGGGGSGTEALAEMQPRKKRVSFSEHVQARIYRSNSSILGQRKKNEKKHRYKRRRSESESESSSVAPTSPTDQRGAVNGHTKNTSVPVAARRDSGIEDESPPPSDSDPQRPLSLDVGGHDVEEASLASGTKCPPTSPTSPLSKRMRRLVSADSALGDDMLVIAATMTMVGIGMAGDVH